MLGLSRPPPCLHPSPLSSSSRTPNGPPSPKSSLARFKAIKALASHPPPPRHPSENFELAAIRSAFAPNSFSTLRSDLPNVLKPGNVEKMYKAKVRRLDRPDADGSAPPSGAQHHVKPHVWSQRMDLFSHPEHLPHSNPHGAARAGASTLLPFKPCGSLRRMKYEPLMGQGGRFALHAGVDDGSYAQPPPLEPPPLARTKVATDGLKAFNCYSAQKLGPDASALDGRFVATVLYKAVRESWGDADFSVHVPAGLAGAGGGGGDGIVVDIVVDLESIRGEERALVMFMDAMAVTDETVARARLRKDSKEEGWGVEVEGAEGKRCVLFRFVSKR